MTSIPSHRPLYVLGAGFSKAISAKMPVTDELGEALRERLSKDVVFDLRPGQTFEDWLTLQVTSLPFLEGFENSRRGAEAARVVAEIASVLDEKVAEACANDSPIWLRQLVALWHAERAVILTFNYDTLLERAVNGSPPTTTSPEGHVQYILGDHVVFPAPPAPQAQFMGDSGAGHTDKSFEVLKLHGSLGWYWAAGDSSGSTLIRVRDKHVFGSPMPLASEIDFSGATNLDRYLIPPVTSKDGYYGSYLANTLWRKARSLVASASALTLVGYSLPPEDRVASQLIAQVRSDIPVWVVDRDSGSTSPPTHVLGNLARLGLTASTAASGPECVPEFVAGKLAAAFEELPKASAFGGVNATADVVVAISKGWSGSGSLYVLAWNTGEHCFEAHGLDSNFIRGSSAPYREVVMSSMPPGTKRLEDFVTAERLMRHTAGGEPFVFKHPHSGRLAVGIGLERLVVEGWELLELKWAPYS
ncbi:SIR2-like protein [Arthrobacter sp. SLBN-83]|uniref:SIR2 family protein n=1 Tax=Arthrobacter sp. SLBN-83 TaxID=2768449 RepID=UPI00114E3916|nr:SIR2 family protein [Arthrobacter sp. SLBN-83]TQJ59274.1 SIR2-like protein [Arthrobacter sp. SLBN-83]